MNLERWQKVKQLLAATLELDPAMRASFLEEQSGDDRAVVNEVLSLLEADDEAVDFLDEPLMESVFTEPEESVPGDLIGPYRILEELGRGGMGVVYAVEKDRGELKKRFALKVIKRGMDTDEIIRIFKREQRLLSQLEHPYITEIYDHGVTDDGRPFFLMEFVEGEPILKYADRHRLHIKQRLVLFRKVCSAVHHAHQNLVVHRDLTPNNVLVTKDGVPKLLDFGIAKVLDPENFHKQGTITSLHLMTPEYASPEQAGSEPVTTLSDVYMLGTILYELMTGHRAYQVERQNPDAWRKTIREHEPTRPSTVVSKTAEKRLSNGEVLKLTPAFICQARAVELEKLRKSLRGDLDTILLKALRKDPQDRYSSVEKFSEDIGRYLGGYPILARKQSLWYGWSKFAKRHRIALSLAALSFVMVGGFLVAIFNQQRRVIRQQEVATQSLEVLSDFFQMWDPLSENYGKAEATALVENVVEKFRNQKHLAPELRSEGLDTIGNIMLNLGDAQNAHILLQEALQIRREVLAPEHREIGITAFNLAKVKMALGKSEAGGALLKESIEIFQDQGMAAELAVSQVGLGEWFLDQEKWDEAEELLKKAYAYQKQSPETKPKFLATTLHNLGFVAEKRRQLEESLDWYDQSIALREKDLGKDHPGIGLSLINQAGIYKKMSRPEKGLEVGLRGVDIARKRLDLKHPTVSFGFFTIAGLCRELERYAEGESLYLDLLEMFEDTGQVNSGMYTTTLNNLGNLYSHWGKCDLAEKRLKQGLAIRREIYQDEPTLFASPLSNLGKVYRWERQWGKSLIALDEAESLRRSKEHSPALAHTLIQKGKLFVEMGESLQGENYLEEGLAIHRFAKGAHRDTAEVFAFLAAHYAITGRPQKAMRYCDQAVAMYRDLDMQETADYREMQNLKEKIKRQSSS